MGLSTLNSGEYWLNISGDEVKSLANIMKISKKIFLTILSKHHHLLDWSISNLQLTMHIKDYTYIITRDKVSIHEFLYTLYLLEHME